MHCWRVSTGQPSTPSPAGLVLRYLPVQQVDELVLDKQMLVEGLQVVHVPWPTPPARSRDLSRSAAS